MMKVVSLLLVLCGVVAAQPLNVTLPPLFANLTAPITGIIGSLPNNTLPLLNATLPTLPVLPGQSNSTNASLPSSLSTIAFSSVPGTVLSNATSVVLVVTRTGIGLLPATVNYTTVDMTAISGTDYGGGSGIISWGPNDNTDRTITISLSPASINAKDQQISDFSVMLFAPSDAYLGYPNSAVVSVNNTNFGVTAPVVTPSSSSSSSTGASDSESSSSSSTAAESSSSSSSGTTVFQNSVSDDSSSPNIPLILGLTIGLGGGGLLALIIAGLTYASWSKKKQLASEQRAPPQGAAAV